MRVCCHRLLSVIILHGNILANQSGGSRAKIVNQLQDLDSPQGTSPGEGECEEGRSLGVGTEGGFFPVADE